MNRAQANCSKITAGLVHFGSVDNPHVHIIVRNLPRFQLLAKIRRKTVAARTVVPHGDLQFHSIGGIEDKILNLWFLGYFAAHDVESFR